MKIELSEALTIISILLAVIGLYANYRQLKKRNQQNRAEYILKMYNDFINDEGMMTAYYKIEYSEFKYVSDFHGSDLEKDIDKLLGYFSNIGLLLFMGILQIEDLKIFKYEFLIIYQNTEVQSYLSYLKRWFKKRGLNDNKFENFQKTAELLKQLK